jgi:hypothetical protein
LISWLFYSISNQDESEPDDDVIEERKQKSCFWATGVLVNEFLEKNRDKLPSLVKQCGNCLVYLDKGNIASSRSYLTLEKLVENSKYAFVSESNQTKLYLPSSIVSCSEFSKFVLSEVHFYADNGLRYSKCSRTENLAHLAHVYSSFYDQLSTTSLVSDEDAYEFYNRLTLFEKDGFYSNIRKVSIM